MRAVENRKSPVIGFVALTILTGSCFYLSTVYAEDSSSVVNSPAVTDNQQEDDKYDGRSVNLEAHNALAFFLSDNRLQVLCCKPQNVGTTSMLSGLPKADIIQKTCELVIRRT